MLLKIVYMLTCRVLGLAVLLCRGDQVKDAERLVLRHEKLHEYRNETYHRDQHRIEVIRPAVLIYFDAACTVLEHYEPGMLITSGPLGPTG
jgi:hypothetical protein